MVIFWFILIKFNYYIVIIKQIQIKYLIKYIIIRIYSGMAHRMAQLLKYNKEYPNMGENDIGPFEKEYRKRLWWICYLNVCFN